MVPYHHRRHLAAFDGGQPALIDGGVDGSEYWDALGKGKDASSRSASSENGAVLRRAEGAGRDPAEDEDWEFPATRVSRRPGMSAAPPRA